MENHRDRPEVQAAIAGGTGTATRFSETLKEDMMYVAVPLTLGSQVVGVVRTAVPLTTVNHALDSLSTRIILAAVLVAAAAAALGFFAARHTVSQLKVVEEGAEQFARGEFHPKIAPPNTREIGGLAESLNAMAEELDEKIATVTSQRNELQAVLSSMSEGVLAIDQDERVISLNDEAARLLGVPRGEAEQRTIQEVLRNPELQRFVQKALASDSTVETDLVLHVGRQDRYLQAHSAVLRNAERAGIGAVVVLNDVTRMRRLEQMRREFVANVSHEIKTPVTSIKGFSETLLDGAKDDPDDSERFLRIISGQADRLTALVEDLLSLSMLEQDAEQPSLPLVAARVRDSLQVAVDVCGVRAAEKSITVELTCADTLEAPLDPPLIERAVVNLLDNALKYSEPGGRVEVEGLAVGGEVVLRVRDEGCGIAPEHLPRLFERFYRVDKARSRDLGGTGLGLAIVKHVAEVHRGSAGVESVPGKGSVFEIHLPAA
jgi:two-component system phosphate regulon sensor histidine kinase PhoR